MAESLRRRARASKPLKEHLFLNSRLSKFGRVCVALWPDNAPKVLSDGLDISVRNANQIMRGDRKVPGRALVLVAVEIIS